MGNDGLFGIIDRIHHVRALRNKTKSEPEYVMNIISLVVYAVVNIAMVVRYFSSERGCIYELPFWMGVMSMGWFFPQAVAAYSCLDQFPPNAYSNGLLFATICSIALWFGYDRARSVEVSSQFWLAMPFDLKRLFLAGATLSLFGFFFQYKLFYLSDEVTSQTQWSGAAVKYLFLASIFQFGFITLWLLYLSQIKLAEPRFLIFIIPGFLLMLNGAILLGRRAIMMDLASYILIGLWFVRRKVVPRGILIICLVVGMALINSIGVYRGIMENDAMPILTRIKIAAQASIGQSSDTVGKAMGSEFNNYVFFRQACEDGPVFDYGIIHWNRLVHNYVPAQLVGRGIKESLKINLKDNTKEIAKKEYGHSYRTGATLTGYFDAYKSFSWLGFVKFGVIGWMIGRLYNYAMDGNFLGQLLYIYMLGTAMHAITHGTHPILISKWIYFFAFGFPTLFWARYRLAKDTEHPETEELLD